MEGALIAFRMPKGSANAAYGRLVKRLYGQETSSHRGLYRYRRKGLLDGVRNVQLIRGVLIVQKEDRKRVIGLLEELGAEYHVRTVVLTEKDRCALSAGRSGSGQREPSP